MPQPPPSPGARFRAALADRPLVVPGVFNALTARIAERAGFKAVYQSGAALSAGLAALPDVGLISQTEFAEQGAYLARAVDIPVISDADTGFGEALSVERTVRLYEAAGLAGLHLEDQQLPKRCGHLSGKTLVGVRDAAEDAREAAQRSFAEAVGAVTTSQGRAHGVTIVVAPLPETTLANPQGMIRLLHWVRNFPCWSNNWIRPLLRSAT
jgi:2-methylisocitrate lyase-like PEP mutase family enzyme